MTKRTNTSHSRGRALAGAMTVAGAGLAAVLMPTGATQAEVSHPDQTCVVKVKPGDSLWSVAHDLEVDQYELSIADASGQVITDRSVDVSKGIQSLRTPQLHVGDVITASVDPALCGEIGGVAINPEAGAHMAADIKTASTDQAK